MSKIIAYDLGTGGIKASLYEENGTSLADAFMQYETFFPQDGWHEQRPMDWWDAVCKATRILLEKTGVQAAEIACLALSGHSLVAAPLDKSGRLLLDRVPIWSDMRAIDIPEQFFCDLPYARWYAATGNGDPAECYSILKLMWMKKHMPEVFDKTDIVLGSKDFVNYMFTGEKCTDPSYASGSGAFNLRKWGYEEEFIAASGLPRSIFPPIVPSHAIVGKVTKEAAAASGLMEGTPVACGGVDNACMALGARGIGEGKVYTSLGSSSWIAVTSRQPIVDIEKRPFVFAHIEEGFYTSATSIFSAGNSFRWMRDRLCPEVLFDADPYSRMNAWAASVPVGSNGVMFNPSLAGGSAQEKSLNIHGGFLGLSLGSTREDMVRASMEGIALNLKICLDILNQYTPCDGEMLLCGGGSKSPLWRQIFADVYGLDILKTNIDQDAASLGAAAIAARGCGLWADYSRIESLHQVESIEHPIPENVRKYNSLYQVFKKWSEFLSDTGDEMQALHEKGIW
jgi:xylulokinase